MLGQIFQPITEKNHEVSCLERFYMAVVKEKGRLESILFLQRTSKTPERRVTRLPGRRQAYLIYNLMHIFKISFLASHIA